MVLAALTFVAALQGPPLLRFPTGGEVVYGETFKVTETAASGTVSGTAERTVRLRVKETTKGKTRFEVLMENLNVRADGGMGDDLRSWLDTGLKEQWVNEQGFVDKVIEPKGNRPFFGLVLPQRSATMPDRWTAKLLPPIGSDRPIEFVYTLDPKATTASIMTIQLAAKDKFGTTTLDVGGRVVLGVEGEIRYGDISTTLVDADAQTTTVIEYRYRKQ